MSEVQLLPEPGSDKLLVRKSLDSPLTHSFYQYTSKRMADPNYLPVAPSLIVSSNGLDAVQQCKSMAVYGLCIE